MQQKQPASPLEWDAEEQQVPLSIPTPATSYLDKMFVGLDTMKVGAWIVC